MNFISEFKNRIFFIFFVWIYFSLLCYYYKNILFFLVLKKLIFDQKIKIYFIYTNVTELFFIYLKLINFFNLQIMFSFFCYHFFLFINPALFKNESIFLKKIIFLWVLTWNLNCFIIIFIIFPIMWKFLENFQKIFMTNIIFFEIKITEYFNFFFKTYFILQTYNFCFVFIIFLIKKNYLNSFFIKKFRKVIFLFIFIFLNLLNFDLINQIILFFVFIWFYEISLIFYFLNKKLKTR